MRSDLLDIDTRCAFENLGRVVSSGGTGSIGCSCTCTMARLPAIKLVSAHSPVNSLQ